MAHRTGREMCSGIAHRWLLHSRAGVLPASQPYPHTAVPPVRNKCNEKKKTECRQIPVMVARDRDNQTVDGILENQSADELCRHLNGRINIEAVVCADASLAHEKLARTVHL